MGCSRVKSEWTQQPGDAGTGSIHQSWAMQGNTFTVQTAARVNPPVYPCSFWPSQPRPTPVWAPGEMLSSPISPPHHTHIPWLSSTHELCSQIHRFSKVSGMLCDPQSDRACNEVTGWGWTLLFPPDCLSAVLPACCCYTKVFKSSCWDVQSNQAGLKGTAMDTALVSSKACHFTSCLISY